MADISFKELIHRWHAGDTTYHYNATNGSSWSTDEYPQDISNCRTCHDNKRVTQPAARSTDNANAWNTRVSQQACGS